MYKNAKKEMENMKTQIQKSKNESEEKQRQNELTQKQNKEKFKQIESILNDLSEENTRLENENKVYKDLYESEVNKKEEKDDNGNESVKVDESSDIDEVKSKRKSMDEDVPNKNKLVIYKCVTCEFRAKDKKIMLKHKQTKHGNEDLQCNKCEFVARNKNMLTEHKTSHGTTAMKNKKLTSKRMEIKH